MAGYWWRLQRQRVSRRRLLRAAGIGVVGLTAAAVMRPHLGATPVARAAGEKERGGRYRVATPISFDPFDPHLSPAFATLIAPRLYNALAVRAPGDASFFFLDLADAIEQPDETTCVFSIRPGVGVAPNGLGVPERDLDAQDALATFDRIMDTPLAFANRFVSQWFDSHSAPDAQTYVVNMVAPYAYFLDRLGTVFTTIPPRELIQNPSLMATNGAGGGPFVPQSPATGSGVALDRNPNYYRTDAANGNAQLPYVDGYDVSTGLDRAARRAAFLSQQIYQYTAADLDEANDVVGQIPANIIGEPVNTFISFGMNAKRPPWNDARIRKAAMHATNRQQYIDLIYGGAARANGLVHWPMGDYAFSEEKLEKLQPYNPALARSLIQQATGEDTVTIEVMYPVTAIQEHDQHLPIFLQQMEQAGFEVTQNAMDFTTWLGNFINVDYDANLAVNQIYDTPEIPLDFHHSLGPQGDETYATGLQSSDIDAAIDAARGAGSHAAHVQAVHDAQRAIYEAGPAFLPLVSPLSHTLYWNFVKNVPQGIGPAGLFLSDWWLSEIASDVPGDVNCSGVSNAIDAALILQQDAALIASVPCPENADVNSDELVNSIDAAIVLQRDAGIAGLPRQ